MKYADLIEHAKKARSEGDYERAIRIYQEAFQQKVMVNDLVDLGLLYLDNKDPLKAIDIFEDVLTQFPELAHVHYGLGIAYEEIGKRNDAGEAYLKAISLDESFADAYFSLALLADEENDEDSAYNYYKKTLLYDADHYWANLNLGSFYEKHGLLDLALQHTENAYRVNPRERMVSYNLGVICAKMQRFDEAIRYYLEEIEKDGHLMSYLNLGLIYKDILRNYEKARYYYLAGISKNKDDANLWYNLGCLYALMNDYENAYSCFLYALVRERGLIPYLQQDDELEAFRSSPLYKKLIESVS